MGNWNSFRREMRASGWQFRNSEFRFTWKNKKNRRLRRRITSTLSCSSFRFLERSRYFGLPLPDYSLFEHTQDLGLPLANFSLLFWLFLLKFQFTHDSVFGFCVSSFWNSVSTVPIYYGGSRHLKSYNISVYPNDFGLPFDKPKSVKRNGVSLSR